MLYSTRRKYTKVNIFDIEVVIISIHIYKSLKFFSNLIYVHLSCSLNDKLTSLYSIYFCYMSEPTNNIYEG